MVKKGRKMKKKEQICIPKCCQQPRSRGPKPRTDFSFFISSSSSSSSSSAFTSDRRLRGSMLEFSTCKDGLSSITTASMDEGSGTPISMHEKKMPIFSLVQSNMVQNGEHKGLFSNSAGIPFDEDESVAQNVSLDSYNHRNTGRLKSDTAETLAFTPNKFASRVTEGDDVWITPGSIVWAKIACGLWWPAEIMGDKSAPISTSGQCVDGHVLVKYYGNHEFAWVDPEGDLSQFEDCFEERSCNPAKAFQDALKQALLQKEYMHSCIQLDESSAGPKGRIQQDQSSDKSNASSSSRTEGDYLEKRRGNRKRKPKVHFDEVTFPTQSARKLRRFRIMRFLGLTAPIGSPFSVTSHVRTAYKACRPLNI